MLFYKNKIKNLEKNLNSKNSFEEKLKKEIETYKRQLNFYKEKMKIEITNTSKKFENLGINMRSFKLNNNNSTSKAKRYANNLNSSKIKKNLLEVSTKKKLNESNMKENGIKVEMPITDNERTNAENEEIFNGDISFTDKSKTIQHNKVEFDISNTNLKEFQLNSNKIKYEKRDESTSDLRKSKLLKFQVIF